MVYRDFQQTIDIEFERARDVSVKGPSKDFVLILCTSCAGVHIGGFSDKDSGIHYASSRIFAHS